MKSSARAADRADAPQLSRYKDRPSGWSLHTQWYSMPSLTPASGNPSYHAFSLSWAKPGISAPKTAPLSVGIVARPVDGSGSRASVGMTNGRWTKTMWSTRRKVDDGVGCVPACSRAS